MSGPAMVPTLGSTELRGSISRGQVLALVRNYLQREALKLGGVRELILEVPVGWERFQCGYGCPEHHLEFVCRIPVVVCRGAAMDLLVGIHRSWRGKWSLLFWWASIRRPAPKADRLEGDDDMTFGAMLHISDIAHKLGFMPG